MREFTPCHSTAAFWQTWLDRKTIQRVVLLYEIIAVVHRVADDVGTEVGSDACMALAVSIEPPVSLLQKLWHGSATLVLGGHIVLDVCPEPLNGLDAWQVFFLLQLCG